jgi:hypothetical protein
MGLRFSKWPLDRAGEADPRLHERRISDGEGASEAIGG